MTGFSGSPWSVSPLCEVVDILDSRRVPVNQAERAARQGDVPYYGATGQVGWIDDHLFDEELVLLGEDGAPFLDRGRPKAYLISGRSWVNNHAHVLRGKDGVLSNRFLLHFLNTVDYRSYVSGTTRLKLPQGPLKTIQVPIPSPEQQERIVARIEELMSDIDAGARDLEVATAQGLAMRGAVLDAAFRGTLLGLEEDSEKGLPQGWRWGVLGEPAVAEVSGGITKNAKRADLPDKRPYLRVANVYADELRLDEVKEIGVTPSEAERFLLREGDLLVVEGNGSKGHIGRVGLWDGSVPNCVHQNHLIRARPNRDMNPRFLLLWLLSGRGRVEILKRAHTTSGLYTLSTSKVASLPVPLTDRETQDRVVNEADAALSLTDDLLIEMAHALRRAEGLRQSVLRAAFSGQLA